MVRIRVGSKRDRFDTIAWLGEFPFQQARGFRLYVEFRFEVQASGVSQVAVGWACVAIDAAVLAASVWIYGLVERDVRAVISCDDGSGGIGAKSRCEAVQALQALPAIVEFFAGLIFKTTGGVGAGAAPPAPVLMDQS
ncbi:protein of unknown function [Candidatus Filomicrobium marinum]|uniref:Uncharacterized protein n=1 Tax=Candidatus Filomicrobium marinum TaxID=1608628 RepID=A0A0D6JKG6_9HYPH|nr:protein of unknown function [Candidatus Filomicrobium marinum]CPR22458.1 protein of unknown function [Candidatus Filomicrobium marinum]